MIKKLKVLKPFLGMQTNLLPFSFDNAFLFQFNEMTFNDAAARKKMKQRVLN
jgi:hypothetical protein